MPRFIDIQVDDFLIGLPRWSIGRQGLSELQSLYCWSVWKKGEAEFAGIRVRQQRDFSIEVDLDDHTHKFITEAPSSRERA